MVVEHAIDRQVFNSDQIVLVDDAPTLLMREGGPAPRNTLMHTRHRLATFLAFRRALLRFGEFLLHTSKSFLVGAEEARIGNLLARREGSKSRQTNINPHLASGLRQRRGISHLTRKTNVPLAGCRDRDRGRLGRAFKRAVVDDLQVAHMRHMQSVVLQSHAAVRQLGVGETRIASFASETREARGFPLLDATEERLKRQINAHGHVLQDLRVGDLQRRTLFFERRQVRLLLVQRERLLVAFPGGLTLFEQVVIKPTTLVERLEQDGLLRWRQIQSVLEGFTHIIYMYRSTKHTRMSSGGPFIPMRRTQGPSGPTR